MYFVYIHHYHNWMRKCSANVNASTSSLHVSFFSFSFSSSSESVASSIVSFFAFSKKNSRLQTLAFSLISSSFFFRLCFFAAILSCSKFYCYINVKKISYRFHVLLPALRRCFVRGLFPQQLTCRRVVI